MQRTISRIGIIVLMASGLGVSGCASQGQSAGLGALIGGAAGAAIGKQAGNPWLGAALGAAVGAAAAYVIHENTRQSRDAQQTAREYRYSPSQGFKMDLKNVQVSPRTVQPGDRVSTSSEYAVLGSGQAGVDVGESWLLKQNNQVVTTLSDKNASRTDGTWVNEMDFEVPSGVKPGRYTVESQVSANGVSRNRQANFTVRGTAEIIIGEPAVALTD